MIRLTIMILTLSFANALSAGPISFTLFNDGFDDDSMLSGEGMGEDDNNDGWLSLNELSEISILLNSPVPLQSNFSLDDLGFFNWQIGTDLLGDGNDEGLEAINIDNHELYAGMASNGDPGIYLDADGAEFFSDTAIMIASDANMQVPEPGHLFALGFMVLLFANRRIR